MHSMQLQLSARPFFSRTSFQPRNAAWALNKRICCQTRQHLAAGTALAVCHQSVCLIFQTGLAYFDPSSFLVGYYEERSGFLITYFASCTAHMIAHRIFHILLSLYKCMSHYYDYNIKMFIFMIIGTYARNHMEIARRSIILEKIS